MGKFVSRGGEKLQTAIKKFQVNTKEKICADFGSSTGGFVDCLLQSGAKRVYAVDTAYGELDWNLRNNAKVVVMERTNAMHVSLPEKVDIITIDTGWTRQLKILPNALKNLAPDGIIISLIKPHYEADKRLVHSGKLKDDKVKEVLEKTIKDIKNLGVKVVKIKESPILGGRAKNQEFFVLLQP